MEDKETQKELSILQGIVEHVLPHVGPHVLTLDLSHSRAASNEVVSGIREGLGNGVTRTCVCPVLLGVPYAETLPQPAIPGPLLHQDF